jgi:hypothetical protein
VVETEERLVMAARITSVSPGLIWTPEGIQRLWFFPDGSEYLRYSPHFHMIFEGGFRQNLPLIYSFVVVHEGKLSVKDYWGTTNHKIEVRNQVWCFRGGIPVPKIYAMCVPGSAAYRRSGRALARAG